MDKLTSVTEVVVSNGGWLAFIGLMGIAFWRSVTFGHRFGVFEATQKEHGRQLTYLIDKLDKHIDKN